MVTAIAPAKINLFLHVTGRQADGYHALQSLVFFADIADRLTLEVATQAQDSLELSGEFAAELPQASDNLVLRAVSALRALVPDLPPLAIVLEKNLPVAAGIGGGSADAAAVLRAAIEWGQFTLVKEQLDGLLLSLGADVPVCFYAQVRLVEGIGEQLTAWPALPPDWGVLLVNPRKPLLTGDVFARGRLYSPAETFAPGDWQRLAKQTRNDLTGPACELLPEIGGILVEIEAQAGCLLARMSGSGPTCFGLFANREAAALAAEQMNSEYWVKAGGIYHGA